MKPNQSRSSGRRSERGPRRSSRGRDEARPNKAPAKSPVKRSLWQKIVAFFTGGSTSDSRQKTQKPAPFQSPRKPESVDVTSPKLYVGNLAFTATESDLSDLFNGVGAVRNAEIVTHKDSEKSKGFGFVLMTTLEEAKRAVIELHDRDFLGRKLVVSGAKSGDRETNYRG